MFGDWSRTKSCAWTRASLPVRKPISFWREILIVHLNTSLRVKNIFKKVLMMIFLKLIRFRRSLVFKYFYIKNNDSLKGNFDSLLSLYIFTTSTTQCSKFRIEDERTIAIKNGSTLLISTYLTPGKDKNGRYGCDI